MARECLEILFELLLIDFVSSMGKRSPGKVRRRFPLRAAIRTLAARRWPAGEVFLPSRGLRLLGGRAEFAEGVRASFMRLRSYSDLQSNSSLPLFVFKHTAVQYFRLFLWSRTLRHSCFQYGWLLLNMFSIGAPSVRICIAFRCSVNSNVVL